MKPLMRQSKILLTVEVFDESISSGMGKQEEEEEERI